MAKAISSCRLPEERAPPQPQQEYPEQGQQLDGPQGPLPQIKQRMPETGGDSKGRRQPHRQHSQKQEGGEALGAVAKGKTNQVRRSARMGITAPQPGEGEGDGQHQHDEQHPGPERGPTRQRRRRRRHHEDTGTQQ